MKKTLLLISLLLCALILVSCGGNGGDETTKKKVKITQAPAETDAPKQTEVTEVDPSTFYNVVKLDKPGDNLRQQTLDAMRKLANIEWICTADHTVKNQFESWGINYTFKAGQKYHGLPYSQGFSNYDEFAHMIVDGKYGYTGPESWDAGLPGLQCMSSINMAIKTCCDITLCETANVIPSNERYKEDLFKPIGDFTYEKGDLTEDIVKRNGADKMYECYSKLQKGDVVISYNASANIRLVADVVFVKNPNGQVNYRRSYVVTLEQTNTLESMANPKFIEKNGYDTTWWMDHQYTFDELFNSTYIPMTFKAYDEPVKEPYVALETEIKADTLAKGDIPGNVRSNYRIHHVLYQLVDANGNVVSEACERTESENHNAYKVNNKYNASELFKNAVHGTNYTFRLFVGIGPGERQVAEVNFTYN